MSLSWDLKKRDSSYLKFIFVIDRRIVTYIMREDLEFLFEAANAGIKKSDFFWAPKFFKN